MLDGVLFISNSCMRRRRLLFMYQKRSPLMTIMYGMHQAAESECLVDQGILLSLFVADKLSCSSQKNVLLYIYLRIKAF